MKKKVLFLCEGNSCNSQMAEGLMRRFYGDEYEVFSAGVNPIGLNKTAIEVMCEVGIDISNQASKHINEFLNQHFDFIITVGESAQDEVTDFWDTAEKHDWMLFEPSEMLSAQEELLPALRELREQIKEKIHNKFSKN